VNIFFPQLQCALVVRKTRPAQGKFVTRLSEGNGVYIIPAATRPRGCRVAERFCGGWNFKDGTCVHLVYASRLADMFRYREAEAGEWLTKLRQLDDGTFCGLIMTRSTMRVSVGCTPVIL